jgi:AraC family transcriptional regulator
MRLMQLSAERIALLLTEHLVTAPSALPPLVAQACTLVHVEFATGLSLAGLARRFEVSEGHFSRMFHHATGLRFVEYLARYRAERAKALLQTSPAPITEIAHACGFRSVSQFNRVFRAVHATTPRALRASFPSPSAPDAFNRP